MPQNLRPRLLSGGDAQHQIENFPSDLLHALVSIGDRPGVAKRGAGAGVVTFGWTTNVSADSRVYAGIHFRSACEDGLVLGRKVGHRVVTLYLQPARK